jgi:hypothetical protein
MDEDRATIRQRALVKAAIIAAIIEAPLLMLAILFMPYDVTDPSTGKAKIDYVYMANAQNYPGKKNVTLFAIELMACTMPMFVAVVGTTLKYR